jgi:hypothetical protein
VLDWKIEIEILQLRLCAASRATRACRATLIQKVSAT